MLLVVTTGPSPAATDGQATGGFGWTRPRWLTTDSWFDPMVAVATIHAAALLTFGDLARPVPVAVATVLLVTWHLSVWVIVPAPRSRLVRDIGSQLAAAAVVWLDGGTESPFFFWVLLFLAGQALRHAARSFLTLAATALVAYAVVMFAVGVTAAAVARLGLLLAFCGVVGYLRNMLDSETAEAREAAAAMLTAFDAAPVGIVLLDGGLVPVYVNGRAQALIDLVEIDTAVVAANGERMTLRDAVQPTAGAQVVRVELDRAHRDLRVQSVPVTVGHDRRLLAFVEDVTAQVDANEERIRFLQAAAHQFRTPLTPIMGYASMLAAGGLDESDVTEAAASIQHGAQRLEQLLERLTVLLALRSAAPRPTRAVPVSALVDACRSRSISRPDAVRVNGDAHVDADPEPAVLALGELFENCRIHGTPPVEVAVVSSQETVEIRVWDSGPGPSIGDAAGISTTWGTVFAGNVVSQHMGHQLGLSQAASLFELAGGSLSFRREGDRWWFSVSFRGA